MSTPAPTCTCGHAEHTDERCGATVSYDAGVGGPCDCPVRAPAGGDAPHHEPAIVAQIERDRARGVAKCEACGHFDSEHRDEMFVGTMVKHGWCFTCHHVLYHERGAITRDDAHHAFRSGTPAGVPAAPPVPFPCDICGGRPHYRRAHEYVHTGAPPPCLAENPLDPRGFCELAMGHDRTTTKHLAVTREGRRWEWFDPPVAAPPVEREAENVNGTIESAAPRETPPASPVSVEEARQWADRFVAKVVNAGAEWSRTGNRASALDAAVDELVGREAAIRREVTDWLNGMWEVRLDAEAENRDAWIAAYREADQEIAALREALEAIAGVKWTPSGDALGATFADLSAASIARHVLARLAARTSGGGREDEGRHQGARERSADASDDRRTMED